MSYRHTSNQTADLTVAIVMADLIKRGWVPCTPVSRDTIYDLVVDRGTLFVTLQIKTAKGGVFHCTNRTGKIGSEFVSARGKPRNRYHYKDFRIDWMVGVEGEICHYYPLSVYKNYDVINVRKIPAVDFGVNVVRSHTNHPSITDYNANTMVTLV